MLLWFGKRSQYINITRLKLSHGGSYGLADSNRQEDTLRRRKRYAFGCYEVNVERVIIIIIIVKINRHGYTSEGEGKCQKAHLSPKSVGEVRSSEPLHSSARENVRTC